MSSNSADLSWVRPEIDRLLAKFGAAFCIYELAGYHSPLTITADFAYVRLHGPGLGKYQESYSTDRLRRWSKQVEEWAKIWLRPTSILITIKRATRLGMP